MDGETGQRHRPPARGPGCSARRRGGVGLGRPRPAGGRERRHPLRAARHAPGHRHRRRGDRRPLDRAARRVAVPSQPPRARRRPPPAGGRPRDRLRRAVHRAVAAARRRPRPLRRDRPRRWRDARDEHERRPGPHERPRRRRAAGRDRQPRRRGELHDRSRQRHPPLPGADQAAGQHRRRRGPARHRRDAARVGVRRRRRVDRLPRRPRDVPDGVVRRPRRGARAPRAAAREGRRDRLDRSEPAGPHPTATSGDETMAGPEVQANAIWTAMHGNPLRDAPPAIAFVAIALLGSPCRC